MKLTDPNIMKKWNALLESEDCGSAPVKDSFRKAVMSQLLENQSKANRTGGVQFLSEAGEDVSNVSNDLDQGSGAAGNIASYDKIMISMVRRAMPNLIAYDICGVQPMSGPSSLIFAMRARYIDNAPDTDLTNNPEAFYNEANTAFSGTGAQAGATPAVLNLAVPGAYTTGTAMPTATGEQLGSASGQAWKEMGFTIDKIAVAAQTRGLKAQYTEELQQDLRAVHGLDAESELSNILSTEMAAEINREIVRTMYIAAVPGAQNTDLTAPGAFDLDTDSNGRWAVEKFKGMMFQIEREANAIARETRRGKGNIIVCSADVASALAMAGMLDYTPALSTNLQVDETGNTFAGVLNGRYKVYVDPYSTASSPAEDDAGHNYFVVGYRGNSPFDAGFFYCPYVPLTMYRAMDSETFQPKIGFKTRYGMVANPFARGSLASNPVIGANTNVYYRRVQVKNLTGTAA